MPLNLASPGIKVREVDLTVGRVDPSSAKVGGLVAPFAQGPVELPTVVGSEKGLLDNFGKPYGNDKHYEHWLTASSYLAYGAQMRVVRADDDQLQNAYVGSGSSIKIKSIEHYEQLQYDENVITNKTFVAKNPGSWADGIRIGIIDGRADQIISVASTSGITVGLGVSQSAAGIIVPGPGSTTELDGYFKGIVTEIDGTDVSVKFLSHVSSGNTETAKDYQNGGNYKFSNGVATLFVGAGAGTTSANGTRGALVSTATTHAAGASIDSYFLESSVTLDMPGGSSLSATATTIGIATANITVTANDFLSIGNEIISLSGATIGVGQITGVTRAQVNTSGGIHTDGATVKYLKKNASVGTVTTELSATETNIGITTTADLSAKVNTGGILDIGTENILVTGFNNGSTTEQTPTAVKDWFSQQTIAISKAVVGGSTEVTTQPWNTISDSPGTSQYATDRGARFDEVHVVIIDGEGKVTGNAGTILEKHLSLSKAKDAEFSAGSPSYWRSYLKTNSAFVFGGDEPSGTEKTGFAAGGYTPVTGANWDQNAEGIIFNTIGKFDGVLSGGKNYDGGSTITSNNALSVDLSKLVSGYTLFENTENFKVDFLMMGSANYAESQAQALANQLIAVADTRKDALAFISPYRKAFLTETGVGDVTVNDDETITQNVLNFFAPVTSSSYAIFDSGYKYMYDRFANTFRYVPLNGDIAGLCARNDIDNFPWFSPAGTTRGAILNAVKLTYNPSQTQRDRLYSNRINPVIVSPGGGITLFGDKTGLAKASAFDRINVRRLFIYLEDAISAAARDQLFEFNDEITRTNFVNIVEPFLRDVQAKRGIQDYVVICDETNNTAAIIDNNEFVAEIFIKPARSINFIGLTFVATRTGVSFEEVIGNV